MLFKAFIKGNKRKLLAEVDIPVERALDWLRDNKMGLIEDFDEINYNKEELENVRDFGSKDRTELDIAVDPAGEVPEDTYRELFGTLGRHTEPDSERDN